MLANKKHKKQEEGRNLYCKIEGKTALEHLHYIETKLEEMRNKLNNDRTQRWRSWVYKYWGHKKKDIYKWMRKDRKRTTHRQ